MTDELRAGRELDAACALMMWTQRFSPDPSIYAWERPDGERVTMAQLPHFSTNWADVTLLEDEIARRGYPMQLRYAMALRELVIQEAPTLQSKGRSDAYQAPYEDWLIARATPEQQARAFLEAMKGAE